MVLLSFPLVFICCSIAREYAISDLKSSTTTCIRHAMVQKIHASPESLSLIQQQGGPLIICVADVCRHSPVDLLAQAALHLGY